MKNVTRENGPRVMMVLSYFHPFRGGAENQALLLSETMRRKGLDVSVLTRACKHLPDFEIVRTVPVRRAIKTVQARTLFGLWYFCSCLAYMIVKSRQYDVLHCHILQGFHSAAAVIAGRMLQKKVVIKIANTGASSDFLHAKGLRGGMHILRLLKKADVLVATSRQSAREACAEGFSDAQIAIIPNGVDTVRFRPSGIQVQTRTRIVCAGRLVKIKGLTVLLEAFHQLKLDGICRRLDIVGAGPEHDCLVQQAAELGCADDVIFHGEVGTVEDFFDNTCVFVQPSLAEGMSNVLLEAMACGLPVVATRTGAATDIIDDGVNGFLVDTASAAQIGAAVKKIIADEGLARRLGAMARLTIEDKYSIEAVAGRYVDLYRSLLAS